jgi:hypothetical protein
VVGGEREQNTLVGESEVFDPATETWSAAGALGVPRSDTVKLPGAVLADGRILVSGGKAPSFATVTTEIYAAARLADAVTSPSIAVVADELPLGAPVVVAGSGFSSASLELRSLTTGQIMLLPLDPTAGRSETSFTSAPLAGFPNGPAVLTAISGGARSAPRIVRVTNGAACDFGVPSGVGELAAEGGSAPIPVATGAGCVWAATTAAPFATLGPNPFASGSGTVLLTLAPNFGPARTGTIAVGGHLVAFSQAAATASCTPAPKRLRLDNPVKGSVVASDCIEPGFAPHRADAFLLLAKAGRAYKVTVKGFASTVVDVVDPNGLVVATATGATVRLTTTTAGGAYLIYVSAADPAATGNYKLKVTQTHGR